MADWKKKTYSLAWLRLRAHNRHDRTVMAFLKGIGVVPEDIDHRRAGRLGIEPTPTSAAIRGEYLAGFAFDWDQLGESTPRQFVEALECELSDSEKRDTVSDILGSLGAFVEAVAA